MLCGVLGVLLGFVVAHRLEWPEGAAIVLLLAASSSRPQACAGSARDVALAREGTYPRGVGSRFAYDEVPYDTEANPDAHPRSMATLARLFGLEGAPPSAARVLEIGCGDGEHMIAAASYLPHAKFVGFDLSAEAIARGIDAARASGTENVALLHRDVRDVRDVRASGLCGEGGAPFDYVVAHGVYSWVPEAVRGDVLAVVRGALGPAGIAFLSVNASPGWELRRALRILMREAGAELEDPAPKVRAALALVDDLASARGAAGFAGVLAKAAEEYRAHVTLATPPDAPFSRYVFHDLLAECNDPFSVEELDARLRAAGLRIRVRDAAASWPRGRGRRDRGRDGALGQPVLAGPRASRRRERARRRAARRARRRRRPHDAALGRSRACARRRLSDARPAPSCARRATPGSRVRRARRRASYRSRASRTTKRPLRGSSRICSWPRARGS